MKSFLAFMLFITTVLLPNTAFSKQIVLNATNTVTLNDYVYDQSVELVIQKARQLDREFPNAGPIYLVLHSGGGSIQEGINLIRNLKSLKRPVHTITLFAASMAFHTVQALGTRYVAPMSTLMQHKAKGGFQGEFPDGNIQSQLDYWVKRVNDLQAVTAKRSGKSVDVLNRKFDNEYWCNAADCIKEGFADELAEVSCDDSLASTWIKENKQYTPTPTGGISKLVISMEYSKCPLETTPISVNVSLTDLAGNNILSSSVKFDINGYLNDVFLANPKSWFDSALRYK